jgi:hypothetical protein
MSLYLGESAGARILAVGESATQVGDDFQIDVTTWDITPAGEMGDVSFRSIDVSLNATGGYAVGITPIIDGVDQAEQTFSGGTTGMVQCQAFIAVRGTRIAARVRTLSRPGALELYNIQTSYVIVRATP